MNLAKNNTHTNNNIYSTLILHRNQPRHIFNKCIVFLLL